MPFILLYTALSGGLDLIQWAQELNLPYILNKRRSGRLSDLCFGHSKLRTSNSSYEYLKSFIVMLLNKLYQNKHLVSYLETHLVTLNFDSHFLAGFAFIDNRSFTNLHYIDIKTVISRRQNDNYVSIRCSLHQYITQSVL